MLTFFFKYYQRSIKYEYILNGFTQSRIFFNYVQNVQICAFCMNQNISLKKKKKTSDAEQDENMTYS